MHIFKKTDYIKILYILFKILHKTVKCVLCIKINLIKTNISIEEKNKNCDKDLLKNLLEMRGIQRESWILRTMTLHSRETCCHVDDRKFKRRMLS